MCLHNINHRCINIRLTLSVISARGIKLIMIEFVEVSFKPSDHASLIDLRRSEEYNL